MVMYRLTKNHYRQWLAAVAGLAVLLPLNVAAQESTEIALNPGNLGARIYVPDDLGDDRPLVVALHGCAQGADDYDDETGWTALADEMKFVVLFPEQRISNNPGRCFNWYEPGDRERGGGEAESIKQMVDAATLRFGLDRDRVFVTGLSGGGAMTAVMLATYPDAFAGGGIVAGVPYGCADSTLSMLALYEGLDCMRESDPTIDDPAEWGDRVRAATADADLAEPIDWPVVSIVHGEADPAVKVVNADDSAKQWTNVHGVDGSEPEVETVGAIRHETYRKGDQHVVEVWKISNLGHAQPIDPDKGCGVAVPYIEDVDFCASRKIAEFWGLGE